MDWRVRRYTEELKKHDRTLFAMKTNTGMIQVWRRAEKWSAAELTYEESNSSQPMQYILAITDNWKLDGIPIDRGIDPLMAKISQMDSWQQMEPLSSMRNKREQEKQDKDRQNRNEIRAIAADCRREFAAACNDINTSSLDMTDARRRHGNYK